MESESHVLPGNVGVCLDQLYELVSVPDPTVCQQEQLQGKIRNQSYM